MTTENENESFDEALATREQIPSEVLPLVSTLIERSMDDNFQMMENAYEFEKKRNEDLQREIADLSEDAWKWRQFVSLITPERYMP